MKLSRGPLLLLVAATLVACSRPAPPPATTPAPAAQAPAAENAGQAAPAPTPAPPAVQAPVTQAPTTTPAPAPSQPVTLPTLSLWDGAGGYAPFTLQGRTITPVFTKQGLVLLWHEGDDVYLRGQGVGHSSVSLLAQSQKLFHLPHTVGQEWKVGDYSYRVTEITEVGKVPALVVSVTDKQGKAHSETWAPGHGEVQSGGSVPGPLATAELPGLPALGQPAPGVTALIVESPGNPRIILSTDGTELGRLNLAGARETLYWQRVGEQEFLWDAAPVNDPNYTWTVYTLREGALQRVQWSSPVWDKDYLPVTLSSKGDSAVNAQIRPDGTIAYQRDGKTVLFRWDGSAFKGEVQP